MICQRNIRKYVKVSAKTHCTCKVKLHVCMEHYLAINIKVFSTTITFTTNCIFYQRSFNITS